MESDEAYFARRAKEERAAAERSEDPYARSAHLAIAEAYELRSISASSAAVPPTVAARAVLSIRTERR